MEFCPRCGYQPDDASQQAFELFHALRDEYAAAQGLNMVEAKDTLCILYGVSVELGDKYERPKWDGVVCELWGRRFFRKSTRLYTKEEMARLIEGAQEAVHEQDKS